MNLNESTRDRIDGLVKGNKVMLFMKGTPQQPLCGFSARTVAALNSVWPEFTSVNVLDDEEIREGIKAYGNWPTIPQLYVDGELVGGCDIVLSMVNSGELHQQLGLPKPDRSPPDITLTDAAAEKIREAMQGHDGMELHLVIGEDWDGQFNLGPAQGDEISAESNGITVLMDLGTSQRARGAVIDWIKTLNGEGLSLKLPSAPPAVVQISVQELAERMKEEAFRLIDVRNEEERSKACIEGSVLLDQPLIEELNQLSRDTELTFICHHGNRSLGAAEYFRKQGFTRLNNVSGGMDAWSQEIDPNVPRY